MRPISTWAWAAEQIDPTPFGGRLWLPDFGANPVFKNYVGVVEVPAVKGWTVIANQYGDRFTPATGGKFDINKHLGGMWAARAAAAAPADFLEEFFSMDQSKINAALNAWAKTGAAQSLLGRAVLDREFEDESGDKRMSLAKFLRYDKKNQAKIDAIARAVAPSTITAAVAEGLGNRTDIDPAELADLLAQRLLVHALNPTTEKGA